MKKYELYAKEIPEETRLIVTSFDNPMRQAILVLLQKKGNMSFSNIKRELGLEKLTLNYHLKKLYSAALIDHFFEHEFGNQEYSYYAVTKLGERVLDRLIHVLIPEIPFQKLAPEGTASQKYETISNAAYWMWSSYVGVGKVPFPVATPPNPKNKRSSKSTPIAHESFSTNITRYAESELST